ncbi:MAG TPA: hypothetical protein PLK88_02940 [Methanothrix sp.]|nr:hypothetical protein [Methanothrix sp.]HQJ79507.1 hypothetical protein [Methanothrix sp.]
MPALHQARCHLARSQDRGRTLPLAPELFSIMADARLALGQISLERYFCDTDYGGKGSVPRFL